MSIYLLVGCDRTQTTAAGGEPFIKATVSERHAFEKTPISCALQAPEADAEFAENVNQLTLFDI